MKRLIIRVSAIAAILVVAALVFNPLIGNSALQGGDTGKAIPADVMKIAQGSCVKCHTEPGNMMALSHLNLTKWDKLTADKQADKAASMCELVTKGKMPPKGFLEKNPGAALTPAQVKTICDWSESINVSEK